MHNDLIEKGGTLISQIPLIVKQNNKILQFELKKSVKTIASLEI